MKRVVVTGPIGAGKSRLARRAGDRLGIPVLHLDAMFWRPGWEPTPADEWDALQRREADAEAWVAEGQFDDISRVWFERADTVVFIDASPLRCFLRVARRRLDRGGSVGTPAGEPSPFHRALMKFVRNQWRYRRTVRPALLAELVRDRPGRQTIVVRGAGEPDFLDSREGPRGTS